MLFEKVLYYRTMLCGKRCENIKGGDLFFRNRVAEIEEMGKNGLGPDEQLFKALSWLEQLSQLELSAKGFEWNLLQEGYGQIAKVFEKLDRPEDKLFCESKEYECGLGLLSYYETKRVAQKATEKQIDLGRRLIWVYAEKGDYDKAFYYTNANMDFLNSAKGIVSSDEIEELLKLVLEDRQEISQKMKK